jgi:hypothetical protein
MGDMKDVEVSIDPGAPGLDALAEEFVARYRRGERPTVSEYIARHAGSWPTASATCFRHS